MNRLLFALASILFTTQLAYALSVDIEAGATDCYFEELEVGEKITISFEVCKSLLTEKKLKLISVGFYFRLVKEETLILIFG